MLPQLEPKTDLYRKTRCRYCEARLPEPFLDLGVMPLANSFLTKEEAEKEEFTCPLSVTRCPHCSLVLLTHVVPAEKMFSNYLYVSSTTATFRKHFADYAKDAKSRLLRKAGPFLAVDIGSNDGLLLACYQNEGMKAVGVEPAKNLSDEANQKGLPTVNAYFDRPAVEKILAEWGPADLVSGNNVFAHIDKIPAVLQNVGRLLAPDGVLVIEFPYLVTMIEKMLFDMIYHEHLSYIGATPLRSLLGRSGFQIFDIEEVASHGGSLRVFIQKKNGGLPLSARVGSFLEREERLGCAEPEVYQEFARRVYKVKEELLRFARKIKSEGKTISGYGAPAKGNTLINFSGLTPSEISYIVDDNPLKQNLLTPGARIPVVPSSLLLSRPTDYVLILAWNFAEEIVKKLTPLKEKGVRFIVPLPEPKIL